MSKIVWACWDGGGNLTPSLGIAAELTRRGHAVHFFGRDEMVGRVEAAKLPATALSQARADLGRYSFHPLPTVFGYTSSPAVGEELVEVVSMEAPDLVVIDAMFTSALNVAGQFGRPATVMLHTFLYRLMHIWRANFTMQSESRQRAGSDALPRWRSCGANETSSTSTPWRPSTLTLSVSCPEWSTVHRCSPPSGAPSPPRCPGRPTTPRRSCCSASAR